MIRVSLTFDIDNTDYISNRYLDEFEIYVDRILIILNKYQIKATWFIRIDAQIKAFYGRSDYYFDKYSSIIEILKEDGHEIGWHHHAYKIIENNWEPCFDEQEVCEMIKEYGVIARKHDLKISRMGWGFQTNQTLAVISQLGFDIDSSAIPRPLYPWINPKIDWSTSTNKIYRPSKMDYRISGDISLSLYEIPITTEVTQVNEDDFEIIRYINPAYKSEHFINLINRSELSNDLFILICHPYEIFKLSQVCYHKLLAFDSVQFEKNIKYMRDKGYIFSTLSELI